MTRRSEEVVAGDDQSVEDGFVGISEDRCMDLLRDGAVGLLAVVRDGVPEVRPVNYAVYRRNVVIRTGRGLIFEAARNGEVASIVVSEFDRFEHTGWSVVVLGRLSVGDPSDSAILTRTRAWARAEKNEWILLSIDRITGRAIAPEA